jgi:Dipeptide/tripeptide permease
MNLHGNDMALQQPPVSQTRSFSTVFLIEMWERFGFYGMQVLMVTYMIEEARLRRQQVQPGLGLRRPR